MEPEITVRGLCALQLMAICRARARVCVWHTNACTCLFGRCPQAPIAIRPKKNKKGGNLGIGEVVGPHSKRATTIGADLEDLLTDRRAIIAGLIKEMLRWLRHKV